MTPHDWNRIGQDISDRINLADAFVVLHGTDTLAYTAAALSFMLAGIAKPVLITGAQRAWESDNSDAPRNVEAALLLARSGGYRGVGVVFDGMLLQGNRVRKADCEADAAFASPNQAPVALTFGQGWALPGMLPDATSFFRVLSQFGPTRALCDGPSRQALASSGWQISY